MIAAAHLLMRLLPLSIDKLVNKWIQMRHAEEIAQQPRRAT